MKEIERKFLLIDGGAGNVAHLDSVEITQGYLSVDPDCTIRVRLEKGTNGILRAWLTIKGKSSEDGLAREEWEEEIAPEKAADLLPMCKGRIIAKKRADFEYMGKTFSVDTFPDGLILVEVELLALDEEVELPEWVGKEVTGDKRYYNSQLAINPYSTWKELNG